MGNSVQTAKRLLVEVACVIDKRCNLFIIHTVDGGNSNSFLLAYCTLTKTNETTSSNALCSPDLGPTVWMII